MVSDISKFPEVEDLRKVWIAHGSILPEGTALQIRQALTLCFADFGHS